MNVARSARPRSAALACAICSAAALMSVPNPRASGNSRSNASRIAPEPVPRAAIRHERFLGRFLGLFVAGLARGLGLAGRRVYQFAGGLTRDHLRQFIERQVDAVVGDAALRKIIGADALGAVAGAYLLAAIRRARRLDALALGVVDARAQDVH